MTIQTTAPDTADQAAPLDAPLADAALTFRRFTPDASAAKFAAGLARRPHTTGRRLSSLAAELLRIGAGTSTLAPARGDRRFTDPAWTGNALLRRIVQSYLAAAQTAGQLVGDAGLSTTAAFRYPPAPVPGCRLLRASVRGGRRVRRLTVEILKFPAGNSDQGNLRGSAAAPGMSRLCIPGDHARAALHSW